MSRAGPTSGQVRLPTARSRATRLCRQRIRLPPLRRLQAHRGGAVWLDLSPDGTLLATTSDRDFPGMVQLWDVGTGRLLAQLDGHKKTITALRFSADCKTLASGGKDGELWLWDVGQRRALRSIVGDGQPVRGLGFAADNDVVLAGLGGEQGNSVRAWNTADGSLRYEWDVPSVRSLAVSPNGAQLAVRYNWTDDNHALELLPWPPEGDATAAVGERLVLASNGFDTGVVAFSPDGGFLATGGRDQEVVIWHPRTGERLHRLSGHTRRVQALAFSPDNSLLVSVAEGWGGDAAAGELRVWNPYTGRLLASAQQPDGATAVAIPRLDTVLTADRIGRVTLWRLARDDAVVDDPAADEEAPLYLGNPIVSPAEQLESTEAWLRQLAAQNLPGTERLRNPHNGHVYQRIERLGFTWHEAKRLCELLGGHLATISTAEENRFIIQHFTRDRTVWLGASDEQNEGEWQWVTGEPFKYTNWASTEPGGWLKDYRNENYLMMGADLYPGVDGKMTGVGFSRSWNDFADHGRYEDVPLLRPLCEWDVDLDTPATAPRHLPRRDSKPRTSP